jgi:hypothetical protein
MFIRLFAALATLSLFSGCAIHPLPEDVAGVDTYYIVRQIRCETSEILRQFVIAWLDDLGRDHGDIPRDPIARDLASRYEREPESINGFHAGLFPVPDMSRFGA